MSEYHEIQKDPRIEKLHAMEQESPGLCDVRHECPHATDGDGNCPMCWGAVECRHSQVSLAEQIQD